METKYKCYMLQNDNNAAGTIEKAIGISAAFRLRQEKETLNNILRVGQFCVPATTTEVALVPTKSCGRKGRFSRCQKIIEFKYLARTRYAG